VREQDAFVHNPYLRCTLLTVERDAGSSADSNSSSGQDGEQTHQKRPTQTSNRLLEFGFEICMQRLSLLVLKCVVIMKQGIHLVTGSYGKSTRRLWQLNATLQTCGRSGFIPTLSCFCVKLRSEIQSLVPLKNCQLCLQTDLDPLQCTAKAETHVFGACDRCLERRAHN